MTGIFLEGFILQASLIFALGAQNIFIFESGLRREHHLWASLVCFLCDLTLILLGVIGAAAIFQQLPSVKILIGMVGVYFLFSYGYEKIVGTQTALWETKTGGVTTLKRSILLAITFSILNPHAYLDAFVLIGGFASKYSTVQERVTLGLGAAIYSGVWFLMLSSLAMKVKPLLQNPARMRLVMASAGVFLIVLSGKLALDVLNWLPPIPRNPYMGLTKVVSYTTILF